MMYTALSIDITSKNVEFCFTDPLWQEKFLNFVKNCYFHYCCIDRILNNYNE